MLTTGSEARITETRVTETRVTETRVAEARLDGEDLGDEQVATLISAGRAGDEAALGTLMASYWRRVQRFAAVNGAPDPDDFASGVVFDVLRRFVSFRGHDKRALDGYVFRVARNRLHDTHRRNHRSRTVRSRLVERIPDETDFRFDDRVVGDNNVVTMLSFLTGEQREVMNLRYVEDRSVSQTAAILGKNPNTIRGLEKRAVIALRLLLVAAAAALVALGIGQYQSRQTVSISPEPIDQPPSPSTLVDVPNGSTTLIPPPVHEFEAGSLGGIGPAQAGSDDEGEGQDAEGPSSTTSSSSTSSSSSTTTTSSSTTTPSTTQSSTPATRPPSTQVPETRPAG